MTTRSKQETQDRSPAGDLLSELPLDRLKDEVVELGKAMVQRGFAKLGDSMSGATDKIGDIADAAPGPGDVAKAALKIGSPLGSVKDAAGKVKDALPGTGSDDDGDGKAKNSVGDDTDLKVTNIVESIDVPVPRDVAYQLWTQFEEFPSFMKKVEAVNQKDPEVLTWKAQIFWSHRTWTAKIVDQVPPERIVWKSEAEKGRVDGAVTFHELAPDLTRVLVSLEYHPQGLFERTGNLWRAQGRRVRVELKHFRRHVANHALINQDDVDGWEGEIHDGKVKRQRRSSSNGRKSTRSSTRKSTRKSTAKKSASGSTSSSNGSGTSGTTAKKTAAKKTARKTTAKKSTSTRPPAKKSAAKKSSARKSASSSGSNRTAAASKRSSSTSARTSSASRPARKTARKTAKKTGGSSSRTRKTSRS